MEDKFRLKYCQVGCFEKPLLISFGYYLKDHNFSLMTSDDRFTLRARLWQQEAVIVWPIFHLSLS